MELRTQYASERKAPLVTKPQNKKGKANEKMGISAFFYRRKPRVHR
jgi:hypothetical protein